MSPNYVPQAEFSSAAAADDELDSAPDRFEPLNDSSPTPGPRASSSSHSSSSNSTNSSNGKAQRRTSARLGSITPAQAKAFLRQGSMDLGTVSPPPAYTTSSTHPAPLSVAVGDDDADDDHVPEPLSSSSAEAGRAPSGHHHPGVQRVLSDEMVVFQQQQQHNTIQDPRSADTPFSSPNRSPAPLLGRRKPRGIISSPPTSMPMGMKERGGPEPDSADWAKLTKRCDPIQIRDRFQNPVHLERTILSPAVSEVSDQTTLRPASSFRTRSSLASLQSSQPFSSSRRHRKHRNPVDGHSSSNNSEDGSLSNASSVGPSVLSAPQGRPTLTAAATEPGALWPSTSSLFNNNAQDARSRSEPALQHVRTVSAPPGHRRPRSSQALVEESSIDDQQEELAPDAQERLLNPAHRDLTHPCNNNSNNTRGRQKSARDIEREQRLQRVAEERFAQRLQERERYLDRKDMLTEKQALIRTLHATTDTMQQSQCLRELGEMALTSAMDLAAAGGLHTDGYKKVADNAVLCLRQALDRQMAVACTTEDVSDTWYLLGRAHEALSNGFDAPEALAQRQFALASYGHALESARSPAALGRIWCSLGVLHCSLQNYAASREAFDRAVREDSRQLRAWLNLGQLWEHWFASQGTDAEQAVALRRARNSYFRAVRLDPDNASAQARLEALGGPPEEMSYTTSMSEGSYTETGSQADERQEDEEINEDEDGDEGRPDVEAEADSSASSSSLGAGERPDSAVVTAHPATPPPFNEDAGDHNLEAAALDQTEAAESPASFDTSAPPEPPVPHSTPIQHPDGHSHAHPHSQYRRPTPPKLQPRHPSPLLRSGEHLNGSVSVALPEDRRDELLRHALERMNAAESRLLRLEEEGGGGWEDGLAKLTTRVDEIATEQRELRQLLQRLTTPRDSDNAPNETARPPQRPSPPFVRPSTAPPPPFSGGPSGSPSSSSSRDAGATQILTRLGGAKRFSPLTMALGDVAAGWDHHHQQQEEDEELMLAVLQRLGARRMADFMSMEVRQHPWGS